jgi:hypothetical protein
MSIPPCDSALGTSAKATLVAKGREPGLTADRAEPCPLRSVQFLVQSERELVFAEIRADGEGLTELVPHEEWKPYMRAVVPARGPLTERKTGLDVPVAHRQVTFRRGWLELEAA